MLRAISITEQTVNSWMNELLTKPVILSAADKAQLSNIKKFNPESAEFKTEGGIIKKSLICPISKKLLKNPVIAVCGHIFSSAYTAGLENCPVENCGVKLAVQPFRVLDEVLECLTSEHSNESKGENTEFDLLENYKNLIEDKDKISRMIDILTCPVSQCVFFTAVMLTRCGHVIERDALGSILSLNEKKCPCCRKVFTTNDYIHLPEITLIARSLAKFSSSILDEQYMTIDLLIRAFMENDVVSLKYLIQCFYEKPDFFNKVSTSVISPEISMTLIFVCNPLGRFLLEKNENLVNLIPASTFNSIVNDKKTLHGLSPLLIFCKYKEGHAILRKNEKLRDKIDITAFYTVDKISGFSPCTLLIVHRAIDIVAGDQRLVEGMTAERLNFTNPDGPLKGYSLFIWLILNKMGVKLFLQYPSIVKNISSTSLFSQIPNSPDYDATALTQIVITEESLGLELLDKHEDLRNKITREGFKFIVATGKNKGMSLFYYFTKNQIGINILMKDQRLRSFINEEMLSARVLTQLFSEPEKIALFEIEPVLCDKISVHTFNNIYTEEGFSASPAGLLLTIEKGCELLIKQPELCRKIMPESFLTVLDDARGFPLLRMMLLNSGLALIKSSAIFRSKLTAAALVTQFTSSAGNIMSPLSILLSSTEGNKIIHLLTSESPELYSKLKALVPPQTREQLQKINHFFAETSAKKKLEKEIKALVEKTQQNIRAVHLKTIQSILTRYKLPDASVANLHKALRRAAVEDNPEDINFLVKEKGCDINAQDDNPHSLKTAMHWAVTKKSYKALEAIVALDARMDIKDFHGKDVVELALQINDPKISQLIAVLLPKYWSHQAPSLR